MKNSIIVRQSLNRQPYLLKLNRMEGELSRMLSNLHSYRCEPCTPNMHAQYLKLRVRGVLLKQNIDKTTRLVQNSDTSFGNIGDEINKVVKEYDKFQKRFSFYLSEVVLHN